MEDLNQTTDLQENPYDQNLCAHCQQNYFIPGYAINLCDPCRKTLIKYPIPQWIKFFSIGLIAVLLISLFRTQHYISAAIDLGKAENAIDQKKYHSAELELAKVLEKFPNDLNANGYMMIASAYNFDYETFRKSYNRIADQKIEDQDFFDQISKAGNFVNREFAKDTIMLNRVYAAGKDRTKLLKILDSSKTEPVIQVLIASMIYDMKDYRTSGQILGMVLKEDPDFYDALSLMSAVKRNEGKFDEALACCDKLLSFNQEDVPVIAQKARIELKRHHDDSAARYADQAMSINPANNSAIEARAMVDFYMGKKKACLEHLQHIKSNEQNTGDSSISTRLAAIINGTEIYR